MVLATVLDRAARASRTFLDDRRLATTLDALVDAGLADRNWLVLEVSRPRWSPVGLTVALIGPAGAPRLVAKLPHTRAGAAALARGIDALSAIRADPRLAEIIERVPEPLGAFGEDTRVAIVETALPGKVATALDMPGQRLATSATYAWIRELHRRTSAHRIVDDRLLQQWVDGPLGRIASAVGPGRAPAQDVARARDRFRHDFAGRRLATCWVHGDLWLGNVLADPGGTLTGVVDWDRASDAELPWHDVLHLLLAPDRLADTASSAAITAAARGERRWRPDELAMLDDVRRDVDDDSPSVEALVALYWLRHTAATLAADPGLGRDGSFVAAHVEPLLEL